MSRSNFAVLVLLCATVGFCQTTCTPDRTPSSSTRDIAQYRLEAIHFEGGRSFSQEQLERSFDVPLGKNFNRAAVYHGLNRLRQLYGDGGHIDFTAIPMLQLDEARGTVVLTLSIDEGSLFTFGRLILAGRETRAGEADALRNAWAGLSGKRFDSSLLSHWLATNAPFLPNDGQSALQHVEVHLGSRTHQANILLAFPSPKP